VITITRRKLAGLASASVAVAVATVALPGGVAYAAQPEGGRLGHVARALAAVIMHDAQKSRSAARTSVQVSIGCCGRTVLAVDYRARSGEYSPSGVYKLLVEKEGRTIHRVTVSATPTKTRYSFGARTDATPTFDLSITHSRALFFGQSWRGEISYDDNPCPFLPPPPTASPPMPAQCVGGGELAVIPEHANVAALKEVFEQALAVLSAARHHEPISTWDPRPAGEVWIGTTS